MATATIKEARTKLLEIINCVQPGKEVTIIDDGSGDPSRLALCCRQSRIMVQKISEEMKDQVLTCRGA